MKALKNYTITLKVESDHKITMVAKEGAISVDDIAKSGDTIICVRRGEDVRDEDIEKAISELEAK